MQGKVIITMQESLRAAQFNASALPNILRQKIQVITLLLLYICIIFHDSKKHQSYSIRPLGKKSPCATKRTHLYYGQQESRMVGTCVSDKI